jgi:hypothetical protein
MTTALEGGEGSASRPGRSLPPGKTRYPLFRRLGGPHGRSVQARKISPPTGIRFPDRPARSQSLYRLRYPAHWVSIGTAFNWHRVLQFAVHLYRSVGRGAQGFLGIRQPPEIAQAPEGWYETGCVLRAQNLGLLFGACAVYRSDSCSNCAENIKFRRPEFVEP